MYWAATWPDPLVEKEHMLLIKCEDKHRKNSPAVNNRCSIALRADNDDIFDTACQREQAAMVLEENVRGRGELSSQCVVLAGRHIAGERERG